MQSNDAGMPTVAPNMIRIATATRFMDIEYEQRVAPTYVTPYWRRVQGVIGPYDGVDKLIQTR
jgi:hypothetical protein